MKIHNLQSALYFPTSNYCNISIVSGGFIFALQEREELLHKLFTCRLLATYNTHLDLVET